MYRTRVYIDGFNLYYGMLKDTPYKWLDLVKFANEFILPNHCVEKILYFTARVSGVVDSKSPARQQVYLNALKSLPQVEIHFGNFLAKTMWRPLTNLPVANKKIRTPTVVMLPPGNHEVTELSTETILPVGNYPRPVVGKMKKKHKSVKPLENALIAEFHTMEEKGSDVNLACQLLNDAWKDLFDVAAVISNDTDLVTPIRLVTEERQKPVIVACPGRWKVAPKLSEVASLVRHIRPQMVRDAQLPDTIPNTTIRKPQNW